MRNGVSFEVIWFDQDMLELMVSCCNGFFAGTAGIYVTHDHLSDLSDALRGFPSRVGEVRRVELGTFNPNHADGGLKMHLYCMNSAGHAVTDMLQSTR
jgi:hypothetical protein